MSVCGLEMRSVCRPKPIDEKERKVRDLHLTPLIHHGRTRYLQATIKSIHFSIAIHQPSTSLIMGLLRWQIFGIYGVALCSMWLAGLQWVSSDQSGAIDYYTKIAIQLAPLWGLIGLGIYSVSWIAYGVVTLRDNPESAKELEQQVKEAKEEMKKRGI